jgi:hypothetical protein
MLTFRPPEIIIWSDACEFGIGGFSSETGRAWKWAIPPELQNRAHINILEFLAVVVGIWIEIDENAKPETCILAFGDNTSAIGWIHKSKFRQDNDTEHSVHAKLTIARKLASLAIKKEIRIFSQWFPGERNQVADFLSRHPGENNENLTLCIKSLFPSQVQKHFKVSPLPAEIESFIFNILLQLPKPQLHHQDTSNLDQLPGESGHPSWNPSEFTMTHSWNRSHHKDTKTKSLVSSPSIFAKAYNHPQELKDWLQIQSEIPSVCWHRPSWKTAFQIQD